MSSLVQPVNTVDEAILSVDRLGFAVTPELFDEGLVAAMRDELQGLIDEDEKAWSGSPHYRDHWMVMNLMRRKTIFFEVLDNSFLHAVMSAMLDEHHILYAFTSSSMPPNSTNFSRRIHVDAPRFIDGYRTNAGFIVALDDFTVENGATEILPGSHRLQNPPSELDFDRGMVPATMTRGSALIVDVRLWHRGGVNLTQQPRHALTANFCRSYMRSHFNFSNMFTQLEFAAMSPQSRKLLGYEVRMPSSLDEYYVPEEERLYRPSQG